MVRGYTTIEQSKKLAEILPIETADMHYGEYCASGENYPIPNCDDDYNGQCCWSLATLLNLIPDSIYKNTDNFAQLEITKRSLGYHDINDNIVIGTLAGNLVDACYKMIIRLYEQNLL